MDAETALVIVAVVELIALSTATLVSVRTAVDISSLSRWLWGADYRYRAGSAGVDLAIEYGRRRDSKHLDDSGIESVASFCGPIENQSG